MTAYTPDVDLYINGIIYSGMVDYAFTIQSGQPDLMGVPQPGVINGSLIGEWDNAFPLTIGDQVKITDSTLGTLGFGVVTDLSVSAQSGVLGDVTRCDFTAMGALNYLVGATWYCNGYTDISTYYVLLDLMEQAGSQSWEEVDPNLTWDDIDPSLTWNWYNYTNNALLNGYSVAGNATGYKVTIPAGYRNVLEDLTTLVLGSHSLMWEGKDGQIFIKVAPTGTSASETLADTVIGRDLYTSTSKSDIRNSITIGWTGTERIFTDATSIYTYGEAETTLTTYLNTSGDVDTIGSYLLDGYSYPQNALTQIPLDLTNPSMGATLRQRLIDYMEPATFEWTTSGVPAAFGSDRTYLVSGYSRTVSKGQFQQTLNVVPKENFYTSILWTQVSPSYTWTSYGTAYPSQAWSDL